jgi:hypothetical protein
MAYPTLADIKTRLGIDDGDSDAFLTHALAAARGAVENYCGYRWEYPDSEVRVFEIYDTDRASAVFNVSDPGLLSLTSVRAWLRWESERDIDLNDVMLRRHNVRGTGPYEQVIIRGAYDFAEITGVFGRGLDAPAEIAEAVMLVAMNIYSQGAGLGLPAGGEVDYSVFEDDLLRLLLRGYRRFR